MTRTKAVLAAVAFAALTTAKVHAESEQEKEMKVCQDLGSVDTAIGNIDNLNKNSTVNEAKMAAKKLSDAADTLNKSAKKVRPQQAQALEDARKDFKKSVDDVPKDATFAEVQASITSHGQRVKSAYQDLKSSVTCP